MRKIAPETPQPNPNSTNHGNWSTLVNSNGGTTYQGLMPKKLRETIAAMTEENTSGANRFMETLPSTISEANTAPAIGAL